MDYAEILYEVADRVATVTLNRPEKLNAWTLQMGRETEHAIRKASDDDAVRVIVVTGAGRAFCAGADLSLVEAVASSRREGKDIAQSGEDWAAPFNLYLPAVKKPVLAAINGHAIGMGLAFALYCDIRFAASSAKLSTTFSKLGLIAEWGMAWMLPRLTSVSTSFDLLYSARTIDAAEAHALGLVDRVVPEHKLAEEVEQYARQMASAISPRSLSIIRKQIYDALIQTNEQSAEIAQTEMLASLRSEDCKEGLAAFMERRTPRFTG